MSFIWISVLSSRFISDTGKTTIQENAPNVGGWGGTCRCPNGIYYEAGDNNDGCGTLACVNGEMIDCNRFEGGWSKRKVICAGIN